VGEDHRVVNNYFGELTGQDTRAAVSLMNGIPDSPANGYVQVKRAIIAFNTFMGCRESLILGLADKDESNQRLPPEDCVIANNLLVGSDSLVEEKTSTRKVTWLGNMYSGSVLGTIIPEGMRAIHMPSTMPGGAFWQPGEDSPLRGAAVGDFPWV